MLHERYTPDIVCNTPDRSHDSHGCKIVRLAGPKVGTMVAAETSMTISGIKQTPRLVAQDMATDVEIGDRCEFRGINGGANACYADLGTVLAVGRQQQRETALRIEDGAFVAWDGHIDHPAAVSFVPLWNQHFRSLSAIDRVRTAYSADAHPLRA